MMSSVTFDCFPFDLEPRGNSKSAAEKVETRKDVSLSAKSEYGRDNDSTEI